MPSLEVFKVRLKQGSELLDLVKDVPSPCRGVSLADLQTHSTLRLYDFTSADVESFRTRGAIPVGLQSPPRPLGGAGCPWERSAPAHPAHPAAFPGAAAQRRPSSFQGPWIACKCSLPVRKALVRSREQSVALHRYRCFRGCLVVPARLRQSSSRSKKKVYLDTNASWNTMSKDALIWQSLKYIIM